MSAPTNQKMARFQRYFFAVASVALAIAVLELLGPTVNGATAAQILLLVLIIDARFCGTGPAIVASQRLAMLVEGLSRTYDHVIIDAGAAFEAAVERLYRLAPRAVLVAADQNAAPTKAAREHLAAAGFSEIAVLDGAATAAPAAAA